MTPRQAIKAHYGINLPPQPADGCIRWFAIDKLRNGFIIDFGQCAIFGSVIDGEAISFDGSTFWNERLSHKDSKKIRYEWMIWEIARSMLERGVRLSEEDSERLSLAVKRLEAWL